MSDNRFEEELQIIAAAIKGDARAQKKIYETYASSMMSVCYRYAGDVETAKDLLQDGFIKLFTKLDSYAGTGAFAGWVRRVFVTTCLEYIRQKTALKMSNPIDDSEYNLPESDVSVVDKISADELMNLISELPDTSRAVFNMFAIEGYAHAEIAEMLGLTEVNCRTLFLRARKSLQQSVQLMNENGNKKTS
jgi:RNA polymerase sigma factor (sigma-70 family)